MEPIAIPPFRLTVDELARYNWQISLRVYVYITLIGSVALAAMLTWVNEPRWIIATSSIAFFPGAMLAFRFRALPQQIPNMDEGRSLMERRVTFEENGYRIGLTDSTEAFIPWTAYRKWGWEDGDLFIRTSGRPFIVIPARVFDEALRARVEALLATLDLQAIL